MAKRKHRVSRRQAMALQWMPLYEMADQVKELAPWEWMEETDIFGVQNPETGEIGFVSVMGMAGEHLSVCAYLGANALSQFLALEEIGKNRGDIPPWEMGNLLFTIPQIQASFDNRDLVEKEDSRIMRRLNLTYSGRNAFPLFRIIHPGCPPILLDMERIPFLIHILEQTLEVAPRFLEDSRLLYPEDVGDNQMYLLRVPQEQDGELVWTDVIQPIPTPAPQPVAFEVDVDTLEALKNVPRVGNAVEIDLFMMMTPVDDKREIRMFFPFILLIVDDESGQVLSHQTLSPLPSIDDMYAQVPQAVVELFLSNNFLPHEINTESPVVTAVLSDLFEELDVPVVERSFLPMINEVKAAMFSHFSDGFG